MKWIDYPPSHNPFEAIIGLKKDYFVKMAEFDGPDGEIPNAIGECIDIAVNHIHKNINKSSEYLVFGWDDMNSILSIYVTDKQRNDDSPYITKLCFERMQQEIDSLADNDSQITEIERNSKLVKLSIKKQLTMEYREKLNGLKPIFILYEGDGSIESI